MQNQIGLLRIGPPTEDGQDYVIPTQLRRIRVGQTATYELAHLTEQPTSLVGNRSSHLYWNFKADLLTKPTELKSQPSSWSMLALREGADAAVTQNTQISPFEAGEHFITQLCINVEEKLKQTLGSDIKLSFLFTSPGYEQTESQTYKQNIRRILRKIVKTNLLKQSNFPQLSGGESFLYEQYGVYHYFSQCEKRIDLGIPKANYIIIDIGGSTTDIALVHLTKSGEVARVFPIYESFQYGGSNFNESILKYVIPEDAAYHSYDSERKSKILSLIEKAKLEILSSKNPEHSKSLKSSGSVYKFTREIIDQAFDKDWNWKIKKNILKVLSTAENDKRITYEGESFKVDGILLAGGTSKLERFRENLQTDPEIGKYFSRNYTISYATQADPSSLASLGLGISIMERFLKGQEGEVESGLPQAEEIYFKVKDNNGNPLKIHRRIHRNGDSRSLLFTLEQLMKAVPEKDNSRIHFPRDLFSDADIEKLPESVTIEFTTDCNSNPQVLSLLLGEPPDIGRNNPTGLCFSTAVDRPNVRSSEISPTKIRIDPYFYRHLPLSKEYRRCDKKDKFSKIDISLTSTGISLEEKRAYVCVDFGMNNTSVAVFAPGYHLNDQDFKVLDISSVEDTLAEHGKIPIPTVANELIEDRKLSVVIDGITYHVIKEITKHPSTQLPVYLVIHNEENFIVNRIDSQSRQYKKIPIGKFTNQIQLSAEQAISLLDLPHFLGVHPQTGAAVGIKPTTEGLHLIHGDFDTLPLKDWSLALTITFEEALELLPQYAPDSLLPHFLDIHPDTGAPIEIIECSEGPTLIHGTFDSVPLLNCQQAQTITFEEALELLPVYEPLVPLEESDVETPTNVGQSSSIYSDLKESLDALTSVLKQQASQNSEILEALLRIAIQPLQTSPKDPEPNKIQSTQLLQNIELRQKDNSFQNSFSDFEEFVIEAGFSYEPSVLRQVWAHSQNQKSRLAILAGPPGSGASIIVSVMG
jgi:hypothetical protein